MVLLSTSASAKYLTGGIGPGKGISVPNRPGARRGPVGGLPRAPDGTGRLSIVRPRQPKGRTVVFGPDGGPYRVRHVSSRQGGGTAGDGRGWLRTAGDCRRGPGMVRDGGGLPATPGAAQVMSYEVKSIRSEVYDINLASTGGPSARTTVPYSPSGPRFPGRSPS